MKTTKTRHITHLNGFTTGYRGLWYSFMLVWVKEERGFHFFFPTAKTTTGIDFWELKRLMINIDNGQKMFTILACKTQFPATSYKKKTLLIGNSGWLQFSFPHFSRSQAKKKKANTVVFPTISKSNISANRSSFFIFAGI